MQRCLNRLSLVILNVYSLRIRQHKHGYERVTLEKAQTPPLHPSAQKTANRLKPALASRQSHIKNYTRSRDGLACRQFELQ
jgi:hypothetical protein